MTAAAAKAVPSRGHQMSGVGAALTLVPHALLVVVLYGCTQTPKGYDRGTA